MLLEPLVRTNDIKHHVQIIQYYAFTV